MSTYTEKHRQYYLKNRGHIRSREENQFDEG